MDEIILYNESILKEGEMGHWEHDDYGHEIYQENIIEKIGQGLLKAPKALAYAISTSAFVKGQAIRRATKKIKSVEISDTAGLIEIAAIFKKHDIADFMFGKTISGYVLHEFLDKVERNPERDSILSQKEISYFREAADNIIRHKEEDEIEM